VISLEPAKVCVTSVIRTTETKSDTTGGVGGHGADREVYGLELGKAKAETVSQLVRTTTVTLRNLAGECKRERDVVINRAWWPSCLVRQFGSHERL
jgi:hypothetical protein